MTPTTTTTTAATAAAAAAAADENNGDVDVDTSGGALEGEAVVVITNNDDDDGDDDDGDKNVGDGNGRPRASHENLNVSSTSSANVNATADMESRVREPKASTSDQTSASSDNGRRRVGAAAPLVVSETVLFAEAEEAMRLILTLAEEGDKDHDYREDHNDVDECEGDEKGYQPVTQSGPGGGESERKRFECGGDNDDRGGRALSSLRLLLDRYLECPTLLDPHLERMCSALMLPARAIVHEEYVEWRTSRTKTKTKTMDKRGRIGLGGIEEGGEDEEGEEAKMDGNGNDDFGLDFTTCSGRRRTRLRRERRNMRLRRTLSAVYALSKVRGRKQVGRFLPHGVDDVEPVLHALRLLSATEGGILPRDGLGDKSAESVYAEDMAPVVGAAISGSRCGSGLPSSSYPTTTPPPPPPPPPKWESAYSLLLWLGTLSLVPFGLDVIDSSSSAYQNDDDGDGGDKNNNSDNATLAYSILLTARSYLGDPGPTRDVASSCLASLLSRPDLETSALERFVDWADGVMGAYLGVLQGGGGKTSSSSPSTAAEHDSTMCIFWTMGAVQSLAAVLKTGSRSNLMEGRLRCVERIWARSIEVAETAAPPSRRGRRWKMGTNIGDGAGRAAGAGGGGGGSIQLRKVLTKLFARVGAAYLPPRLAPWRYQRGKRSLVENMKAARIGGVGQGASIDGRDVHEHDQEVFEDDDLFLVPDPVEDAVAQLLLSLADPATVVRWSAAKGLGRISERLPHVCADDVLDALLELFGDEERDGVWHGGCLALAELARRGLLLPSRLKEALDVVVRAMSYDVRRGRASVGSNVRDAACYVVWAFARAYAPLVLRPHVPALCEAVVLCALFDREVQCRRAAGAAFQECVGRQGADNFKHGIEILTAANYYSLGNRTDAYTSVAQQVASFEEYRIPIFRHLTDVKLSHWDVEVRTLASRAVRDLIHLDNSSYVARDALPRLVKRCTAAGEDPVSRHGAVLGVAEAVLGLGETTPVSNVDGRGECCLLFGLDQDIAASLAELVPSIERERLYRGRCGEDMRAAVGRLIECISRAKLPLTVKQQVRLLDSVDDCLRHPKENVQEAAALGLFALLRSYFPVGPNGPSERLQKRVVDKYIHIVRTEDNPAATRGFALALGKIPRKLIAPNAAVLDSVLSCLFDAARVDRRVGDEGDAETRRNALLSLAAVCEEVGASSLDEEGALRNVVGMSRENVAAVFEAFLASMEDYNSDRRGDVGSWCRVAAMSGLVCLSLIAVRASNAVPHLKPESFEAPNSGGSGGKNSTIIVPTYPGRMSFLDPDVSTRVAASIIQNEPFKSKKLRLSALHDEVLFDDCTCIRVLGALLKQLSEKLDSVRHHAGVCLEQLLLPSSFRLSFVPSRDFLLDALNLKPNSGKALMQDQSIDWSSPAVTFPLVMRAIDIEEFFDDILSGMVISVGGLTKSVTKYSTASILHWAKTLSQSSKKQKTAKMGFVFLRLFDRHYRDGRVINPLLKTTDVLITHGCLDEILFGDRPDFAEKLLLKLRSEANNCTDVGRLLSITAVLIGLLHDKQCESIKTQTLHFIMIMLGHRYPRVRRATAEQLYVKLLDGLAFAEKDDVTDEVARLLMEVAWDKELDPPGNVRECRNRVSDLLGVKLPQKEREKSARITKKKVLDTFESYASLVNDVT